MVPKHPWEDDWAYIKHEQERADKHHAIFVTTVFLVIIIWGLVVIAALPNCAFGGGLPC